MVVITEVTTKWIVHFCFFGIQFSYDTETSFFVHMPVSSNLSKEDVIKKETRCSAYSAVWFSS